MLKETLLLLFMMIDNHQNKIKMNRCYSLNPCIVSQNLELMSMYFENRSSEFARVRVSFNCLTRLSEF